MISESIELLGRKATDRITGFAGTITSVGFDLYGCVQAVIMPGVGADGKPQDGHWFDVKRLDLGKRVMDVPKFAAMRYGEEGGAAEKPVPPG